VRIGANNRRGDKKDLGCALAQSMARDWHCGKRAGEKCALKRGVATGVEAWYKKGQTGWGRCKCNMSVWRAAHSYRGATLLRSELDNTHIGRNLHLHNPVSQYHRVFDARDSPVGRHHARAIFF